MISQDTSAYGVDIRYREAEWRGQKYETRFLDLARGLGELGIWVRMHYVYPYPHVDNVIPLMAERKVLPYLDIPFQHGSPTRAEAHEAPGTGREDAGSRIQRVARDLPGSDDAQHVHRRIPRRDRSGVRGVARLARRSAARSRRRVQVFAGGRRGRERRRAARRARDSGRAARALHAEIRGRSAPRGWPRKSGIAWKCWWIRSTATIADRAQHGGCAGDRRRRAAS